MVINKTIREEDDVTLSLEPTPPKRIFSPAAASISSSSWITLATAARSGEEVPQRCHSSCTTGLLEFAECPKHSAKGIKHSANCSPSVTLGELHSVKNDSAKTSLPSVFCRALGKGFAECRTPVSAAPVSAHPSPAFF